MDTATLIVALDFSRSRLLAILETLEKSGQDITKVLAWRPGTGRAHIAWQAMHCAATHDRYLNVGLQGGSPQDADLVTNYAGGSKPADENIPSLSTIREKLAQTYEPFKQFVSQQTPESLAKVLTMSNGQTRAIGESIVLLTWHEAHHQGQIHITWNLYKAAHGIS